MATIDVEHDAFLGMLGGAIFVPFALLKGSVGTALVQSGTHLPGLSNHATLMLFHISEAVPVLLVAIGFHGIAGRTRGTWRGSWLGTLGYRSVVVGFALVLGIHVFEHVTDPGRGPLPADLVATLPWGYYVGWLCLFGGLGLFGVAILESESVPRWVPWLLMTLFPLGVWGGLALVALDLFTFAGTHRFLVGVAFGAIGFRLWSRPIDHDTQPTPAAR